MEYARKCNADLLLATDPDCDRVGIAVKNRAGEYELLTGNQTGMLLLDYICSQRIKHGKMASWSTRVRTGALPRFAVVFILIFLIHSTGTAALACAAAPVY